MDSAAEIYDLIKVRLREAGLLDRRVMDTPGWETAVASVKEHIEDRGWRGIPPMGPIGRDTWANWLHILSHCIEDGHSLAHAKYELQLVELAITALSTK